MDMKSISRNILLLAITMLGGLMLACSGPKDNNQNDENMKTTLKLTKEWDKTFPLSDKVDHKKVTFFNRYGIELAADMYTPKGAQGKLPAIAVSGPFGAVKEQSSGLYAQHMAERGFVAIAFDPSYTGESGGEPRRMASPDINTEDFLAAVDFLSVQDNVDAERIGIIGICGWGGMAVNAAAIDPRIKATVASTMYDMTKVTKEGYFGSEDTPAQRMEKRKAMAAQRTEDYRNGTYKRAGGVIDPLPEASSILSRTMLHGSSRTTTLTTRPRAAITSAAATPTTVGMSSVASRSSTNPSWHLQPRSRTPCCSSTARRPTRAISRSTPLKR